MWHLSLQVSRSPPPLYKNYSGVNFKLLRSKLLQFFTHFADINSRFNSFSMLSDNVKINIFIFDDYVYISLESLKRSVLPQFSIIGVFTFKAKSFILCIHVISGKQLRSSYRCWLLNTIILEKKISSYVIQVLPFNKTYFFFIFTCTNLYKCWIISGIVRNTHLNYTHTY